MSQIKAEAEAAWGDTHIAAVQADSANNLYVDPTKYKLLVSIPTDVIWEAKTDDNTRYAQYQMMGGAYKGLEFEVHHADVTVMNYSQFPAISVGYPSICQYSNYSVLLSCPFGVYGNPLEVDFTVVAFGTEGITVNQDATLQFLDKSGTAVGNSVNESLSIPIVDQDPSNPGVTIVGYAQGAHSFAQLPDGATQVKVIGDGTGKVDEIKELDNSDTTTFTARNGPKAAIADPTGDTGPNCASGGNCLISLSDICSNPEADGKPGSPTLSGQWSLESKSPESMTCVLGSSLNQYNNGTPNNSPAIVSGSCNETVAGVLTFKLTCTSEVNGGAFKIITSAEKGYTVQ